MIFRFTSVFILSFLVISCISNQDNDNQTIRNDTLQRVQSDTLNDAIEYLEKQNFNLLVRRFEDPERKLWQNPDLVINKLGDISDKTIADIGAGTGYFTFRLASLAGKVIAIDIDERFLEFINERKLEMDDEIADKVETRLTERDNPALANGEADVVLIVNTYLFIKNRSDYLGKIKKGLSKNGKVVIVDFKSGSLPVGPPEELKIPPSEAVNELMKAGFGKVNVDNSSLQYQYIITAE